MTIADIQSRVDARRRSSTLPLHPITVLEIYPDQTVRFSMNGQEWRTLAAWRGDYPVTTGNTRLATAEERGIPAGSDIWKD